VTTGTVGFLESVIGGESGNHVRMSGDEDTESFPWDFRPSGNERNGFHSAGSSVAKDTLNALVILKNSVRLYQ
jgi:hypothetical protein